MRVETVRVHCGWCGITWLAVMDDDTKHGKPSTHERTCTMPHEYPNEYSGLLLERPLTFSRVFVDTDTGELVQ